MAPPNSNYSSQDTVIQIVERANQRGGRMLSVVDLVEAGTLSLVQAAWLLGRVEEGASWLVGAKPGGAGKTTVMGALLAMLPGGETVRLANEGTGWESSEPGDCVVAYEISRGPYDAYIWGEPVARLARLGRRGCRIVTNLHADTLGEARDQVVYDNGVAPEDFPAFEIFLPIALKGRFFNATPRVGRFFHFREEKWNAVERDGLVPGDRERAIAVFLEGCRERGLRSISEVRSAWLKWRE